MLLTAPTAVFAAALDPLPPPGLLVLLLPLAVVPPPPVDPPLHLLPLVEVRLVDDEVIEEHGGLQDVDGGKGNHGAFDDRGIRLKVKLICGVS